MSCFLPCAPLCFCVSINNDAESRRRAPSCHTLCLVLRCVSALSINNDAETRRRAPSCHAALPCLLLPRVQQRHADDLVLRCRCSVVVPPLAVDPEAYFGRQCTEKPVAQLSLTVTCAKRDIPAIALDNVFAFLQTYAKRGLVSLERGKREEQLHVQGVFELQAAPASETLPNLVHEYMPNPRGGVTEKPPRGVGN
mmetsp:Transcript_30193/g.92347  ORF Transcript_30193/g.92347 Transcript_30193/m.92347 type:complete len:196 (+) Transcript_30193:792-1379(+)